MKNKLYDAIIKSVTGRLSTYIVQFASLAIYARIFTPTEFGVIASIQVFVIFFQMLADIGIGPAIINETKFEHNKRDGIFTVTAILGVTISIVFYAFSYVLNSFYDGYEYQSIAQLVCVAIFFNALSIVPITALNKDAKFIHIAAIDICVEFISLSIVYFIYTKGGGILALASRPMFQSIFKFSMAWVISSKTEIGRSCFGKQIFHFKSILSFSSYQFSFNFINYFSRNLDNILIAKYFGMTSVGIYEKAYQLMRYPLMITTFAMTPAIQPILTKVRDDVELIVDEHNKLTTRLLALSILISTFIYINSHSIILFLFGEQWLEIKSLIEIFVFMIPVQAVLSSSGSFFQVMNRPKLLFVSGALSALVNVSAIVIGIYLGEMKYVALSLVIAFSINFVQCYWLLFKYCFNQKLSVFYLSLLKGSSVVILPIIGYVLISLMKLINFGLSPFWDLAVNGIVFLSLIVLFYIPIKMFYQVQVNCK